MHYIKYALHIGKNDPNPTIYNHGTGTIESSYMALNRRGTIMTSYTNTIRFEYDAPVSPDIDLIITCTAVRRAIHTCPSESEPV